MATATVNGVTSSYVYNADGGRYSKTVGGITTVYYYVDGVLYAMTCGDDTLEFRYDDKGLPYVMVHNGNDYYYYEYNLQGDVVGLFNEGNSVQVAYDYDPYGDLLALTDTSTNGIGTLNPFRYRGYYYDAETGFYYCNSRYYDPETGRWINADGYVSTGQGISGHNMFTYCGNNPVDRSDNSGEGFERSAGFGGMGGGGYSANPYLLEEYLKRLLAVSVATTLTVVAATSFSTATLREEMFPIKRSASATKAKAKEKDIVAPPPSSTPIYRYGGTNPGNLTPREKDRETGLSFSTVPMPGAAVTTIEALNATGVVYAVKDGPTHVSVRPVGATMDDWINAGSSSIWTQAVKATVIKWDGGN